MPSMTGRAFGDGGGHDDYVHGRLRVFGHVFEGEGMHG